MTRSLLASLLLALPMMACATDSLDGVDEGWHPDDRGGKADDANALSYKTYDVLFTNPLCRTYSYATPVKTADGSQTDADRETEERLLLARGRKASPSEQDPPVATPRHLMPERNVGVQ